MRVYEKEFKEEVIKLSYEIGSRAASEQLGIPPTTLYTWRSRIKQHGSIAFVGSKMLLRILVVLYREVLRNPLQP
ncbi:transposase [Desulfotruncus alcoholivorax]|uniref:transposase n=1 Tax=Desulfotruncus alcoholivorax TaxID=265477 RepID=UPI00068565FE|nr:transposase [Desulfotruncus alcoholivorax]